MVVDDEGLDEAGGGPIRRTKSTPAHDHYAPYPNASVASRVAALRAAGIDVRMVVPMEGGGMNTGAQQPQGIAQAPAQLLAPHLSQPPPASHMHHTGERGSPGSAHVYAQQVQSASGGLPGPHSAAGHAAAAHANMEQQLANGHMSSPSAHQAAQQTSQLGTRLSQGSQQQAVQLVGRSSQGAGAGAQILLVKLPRAQQAGDEGGGVVKQEDGSAAQHAGQPHPHPHHPQVEALLRQRLSGPTMSAPTAAAGAPVQPIPPTQLTMRLSQPGMPQVVSPSQGQLAMLMQSLDPQQQRLLASGQLQVVAVPPMAMSDPGLMQQVLALQQMQQMQQAQAHAQLMGRPSVDTSQLASMMAHTPMLQQRPTVQMRAMNGGAEGVGPDTGSSGQVAMPRNVLLGSDTMLHKHMHMGNGIGTPAAISCPPSPPPLQARSSRSTAAEGQGEVDRGQPQQQQGPGGAGLLLLAAAADAV